MGHRIREAMKDGTLNTFGTNGGAVEVDETYIGRDPKKKVARGGNHKQKVLSLIDRTACKSRSMVIDNVKLKTLIPLIQANVDPQARVMTDDARHYKILNRLFAEHGFTKHSNGQYVSHIDKSIHSNTVEGFFSIFKRGMKGIYQHCGHNHLNRYLAEFDFRYNNRIKHGVDDEQRAEKLLLGVKGKRLTYQTTH